MKAREGESSEFPASLRRLPAAPSPTAEIGARESTSGKHKALAGFIPLVITGELTFPWLGCLTPRDAPEPMEGTPKSLGRRDAASGAAPPQLGSVGVLGAGSPAVPDPAGAAISVGGDTHGHTASPLQLRQSSPS